MSDNHDETEEEEVVEQPAEPEFSLDAVREQVSALHDQLDQIKQAGQEIPKQLQEEMPEDPSQEEMMEYQEVISKANLLYRRVESGDRSVVRGE